MGLDMYLLKRIYIGANYDHNKIEGAITLTKGEDKSPIKINLKKVTEIIEEVAYWRKANAIHKYFVDNVQDGEDDCREYYVSKEVIEDLISKCRDDLKYFNKLKAIEGVYQNVDEDKLNLITQEGFFFGDTEYTEHYVEILRDTIELLTPLLTDNEWDIYYSSSW